MASTYTQNNKFEKPGVGEQAGGTWGSTSNTNFDLIDSSVDGFVAVALTGTTHTLNIPDAAAADGRNKVISFTGTLAAANTVTVTPNTVEKLYFLQNNTTGGQNVIIAQGSGSTVTIKPGYSSIVYLDGAGAGAGAKEVLTSLKLTNLLEATRVVFVGSGSGNTELQASAAASGTLTLPAATDTLVGRATTDTLSNKTLAAPILGTPTSGTLTNCTGLPISTGVAGLATGVAAFLATPTSANLAAALTDETGTGANVFATSPTLTTPTIATNATVPLVIGGTGTTSTLALRSTSGVGTTGADIVFQTGSNGATEAMRIQNGGSSNFGKIWTGGVQATGHATLSYGDLVTFGGSINGASLTWDAQTNAGNTSVMARLRPRWIANLGYALDVFAGSWNNAYDPGSAVATFESVGNLKIGGTADRATTAGTNQLVLFNGTAPVGTLANGCSFYATAGEMRVMDAAGNATLLSPHDKATNEWIYDSTHTPSGKRLKISVEKLLRFVNDHFGLDCIMEEE